MPFIPHQTSRCCSWACLEQRLQQSHVGTQLAHPQVTWAAGLHWPSSEVGRGLEQSPQQGHIMTNVQPSGLSIHRSMLAARLPWLHCALET